MDESTLTPEATAKIGSYSLVQGGQENEGGHVSELQQQLTSAGFKVNPTGVFDAETEQAVRQYQESKGLKVDGRVGQQTWGSFFGMNLQPGTRLLKQRTPAPASEMDGVTPTPGQPSVDPGLAGAPSGPSFRTRATGYYPHDSALEGGHFDRKGKRLNTLQDYLAGRAPYVSVAMDQYAKIPYGKKLRIKELEEHYGRPIEFRVVDCGKAFKRKGTSRIDICTANNAAANSGMVNRSLTASWA